MRRYMPRIYLDSINLRDASIILIDQLNFSFSFAPIYHIKFEPINIIMDL